MKVLIFFLLLTSSMAFVQCNQSSNRHVTSNDLETETIEKRLPSYMLNIQWVRCFEEDGSFEGLVFRPSYYKEFPPARFRQVVKFNSNYTCDLLSLSPNDAHESQRAKWRFLNNEVIEIYETISAKKENVLHRWSVLKSEKDLLVVKE